MGYSHYIWQKRDFTDMQWLQVRADFRSLRKLAFQQGIIIAGWDGNGEPETTDSEINFNGWNGQFTGLESGESETETFTLNKTVQPPEFKGGKKGVSSVKTYGKPYDIMVTAFLVVIESKYPGIIEIRSDGTLDNWKRGISLAKLLMGSQLNEIKIPKLLRQ